ncbi:hypothetical protein F5Y18DRAFT_426524 [Xylariaceae sp. FL1019]|nr:hypothetical protein F5Y18DRAFT_426524 [Xylariaceae sp. FL1019]
MPHFDDLSVELRLSIWRFAVPEVQPQRGPQVFALQISSSSEDNNNPLSYPPWLRVENPDSGESRSEALRWFPDVLTIDDEAGGTVRFNADRDLVLLDADFRTGFMGRSWNYSIDYFTRSIRHLGFSRELYSFLYSSGRDKEIPDYPIWQLMKFLRPFQKLHSVYYCHDIRNFTLDNYEIRWCASDKVNCFKTVEEDSRLLCWPDLVENEEYAINEPSLLTDYDYPAGEFAMQVHYLLNESRWSAEYKAAIREYIDQHLDDNDLDRLSKVQLWKIMSFSTERAKLRFYELDPDCEDPNKEVIEAELVSVSDFEDSPDDNYGGFIYPQGSSEEDEDWEPESGGDE